MIAFGIINTTFKNYNFYLRIFQNRFLTVQFNFNLTKMCSPVSYLRLKNICRVLSTKSARIKNVKLSQGSIQDISRQIRSLLGVDAVYFIFVTSFGCFYYLDFKLLFHLFHSLWLISSSLL